MSEDASAWLASAPVAPPEELEDGLEEVELLPPLERGQPVPRDLCFPDGTPNPYAVMVENRRRADVFFLTQFSVLGDHQEAARETCDAHGHDARASRCLRCGVGTR